MYIINDDTIYDTVYLRALKSWQDGQLYSLAHGTETKKQGVALTGRNTTGPPRAAPGELRCIFECYRRRRQTPATATSLAPTPCV